MNTKIPIEQMVGQVLAELERLNYSYNSLCGFRAFYKRVVSFAKERGETYFSEELGREFLKEKYGCTINYYAQAMPKCFKEPIRRIRVLGDFQLHGVVIRRIVKKTGYVKPCTPFTAPVPCAGSNSVLMRRDRRPGSCQRPFRRAALLT